MVMLIAAPLLKTFLNFSKPLVMKKFAELLLVVSVAVFCLSACNMKAGTSADTSGTGPASGSVDNTTKTETNNQPAAAAAQAKSSAPEILGSFVGPFGDNKITLLITKTDGASISGRSIVGGNDR